MYIFTDSESIQKLVEDLKFKEIRTVLRVRGSRLENLARDVAHDRHANGVLIYSLQGATDALNERAVVNKQVSEIEAMLQARIDATNRSKQRLKVLVYGDMIVSRIRDAFAEIRGF